MAYQCQMNFGQKSKGMLGDHNTKKDTAQRIRMNFLTEFRSEIITNSSILFLLFWLFSTIL